MPVTIYDISRELSLSAMTVSRVLNGRGGVDRVAPETRARVERAAREMGYRPNRAARALVTGRTQTIALWISHVQSSVYAQIVEACRGAVQAQHMELNVVEMDWHFAAPDSQRRFLWPVDGIIAIDPPQPEMLVALLGDGPWQSAPRVHLGSGQPVRWEGDYVFADRAVGVRDALRYLIERGCRRVAYALPGYLALPGLPDYDAYVNCLREAGLTPECIRHDDWSLPAIRQTTLDYVQRDGHPDGLFCHNDEMAIASFRGLRDAGLRVPDDVALIGCEGNAFLGYFDPPISTVALPIAEMCHRGWQALHRRIREPDAEPQQTTLPVTFHARESAQKTPAS